MTSRVNVSAAFNDIRRPGKDRVPISLASGTAAEHSDYNKNVTSLSDQFQPQFVSAVIDTTHSRETFLRH